MGTDKSPESNSDFSDITDDETVEVDIDMDDDSDVVVAEDDEFGVDVGDLDEVDELAAIRNENAELRKQIDAQQPQKRPKPSSTSDPTWRKVVAGILIFLAILSTVAAVSVVWAKTTLQDEDQFVATLAPLPKEEDVATVISVVVADLIAEGTGLEARVSELLPSDLEFLAIPVTNSITTLIAAAANELVQSDAFTQVWTVALRGTHRTATLIISGTDGALVSENGEVSINLDEVAGQVIERVEISGIDLSDIDVEFGSIVVYQADQLASIQALAQAIDTAGWLIPLLAVLLIAAAIGVSRNRRRTVEVLGFGTAIGLLLSLIGLRLGRNFAVNAIEEESKQRAAGAAWDLILDRLYQLTWALLILALIVGIVAWVVGPSSGSARTRAWASRTLGGWRGATEEHPNSFSNFVAEWKRTIEVIAVMLGLLFIIFGPSPTGLSVMLTAAVVLAVIVAVEVLAVPDPMSGDDVAVIEVDEAP